FERVKEEIRIRKPLPTAIDDGFARAWPSIRDSNVSSIITCVILAWFGTSLIQGFAITLGLGILVSMFSAIVVTKTFMKVTAGSKLATKINFFGINNIIDEQEENV
ncbi:protein translocase subunit SecD, partial [Patescibacteria group bacterium]|nr:protein translocase subunit SecD [Patescibacteria group bacterium]